MKKRKRTVIIKRRRFAAFLAILLILTCCGFSSVKNHTARADEFQYILVHVKPGDTLWSIAKNNNFGKKNTRSLVYDIKNIISFTAVLSMPEMNLLSRYKHGFIFHHYVYVQKSIAQGKISLAQ